MRELEKKIIVPSDNQTNQSSDNWRAATRNPVEALRNEYRPSPTLRCTEGFSKIL
jgi:hypothetical protein